MGLQVRGTSVESGTLIVECRISINMASLTLEQVAGKRKKLLGDMVKQMEGEVRVGLSAETADQAARMVQTKLEPMFEEDAQAFNKDVRFQQAVDESLKTKRSVELAAAMVSAKAGAPPAGGLEAAIKRVEPLQDNVVDLSKMALGADEADVAVVIEWMRSNPSGLTRLTIDVAKASVDVVVALHELVAQTTTLIDLDVMEERASNLNVLQLNAKGTEKLESIDLSSKSLGPVSAASVSACVRDNPVLVSLKCALATHHTPRPNHAHPTTRACARTHENGFAFASAPLDRKANTFCARSIGYNELGHEGGAALAEGLKGNSALTSLK